MKKMNKTALFASILSLSVMNIYAENNNNNEQLVNEQQITQQTNQEHTSTVSNAKNKVAEPIAQTESKSGGDFNPISFTVGATGVGIVGRSMAADATTMAAETLLTTTGCDTYGIDADLLVDEFIYGKCWNTAFPHRIMGNDEGDPSDEIGAAPGAHTNSWCKCGEEPYAYYGTPRGMWFPVRLVEVVRGDGSCSPTQGKLTNTKLSLLTKILHKTGFFGRGNTKDVMGFKHFHSWKLDWLSFYSTIYTPMPQCRPKIESDEHSYNNIPWSANDPVLGNLYYPEYLLTVWAGYEVDKAAGLPVSTGLSLASCAANSLDSTPKMLRTADDLAYWLGGCYRDNLPAVGRFSYEKGLVNQSQLIVQRSIMHSARKNLIGGYAAWHTAYTKYGFGDDINICSSSHTFFPHKSTYKFSMIKPYSEAEDDSDSLDIKDKMTLGSLTSSVSFTGTKNLMSSASGAVSGLVGKVVDFVGGGKTQCAHRWGASSKRWGTGKNSRGGGGKTSTISIAGVSAPVQKEKKDKDAVYIVWRWIECCEIKPVF